MAGPVDPRPTLAGVQSGCFAGLRERGGGRAEARARRRRALADVWPALGLGEEPAGLLYAVNRE